MAGQAPTTRWSAAPAADRPALTVVAAETAPAYEPAADDGATATAVLQTLHDAVDAAVELELEQLHPDDLPDVVRQVARARTRIEALQARIVAQMERRRAFRRDGYHSAKDWVAKELNVDPRKAANDTRLARDLQELPTLADAYASGDISGDHAAIAAREVRQAGPDTDRGQLEAELTQAARTRDPRQLSRDARRRRIEKRPKQAAAAERAAFARRGGRYIERDDGGAQFILDLTPGDYEIHRTAAQARMTKDPKDTPEDQRRTWAQRLYDAEMEIHRRTLCNEDTPTRNGSPVTGTVVVDLETLEAAPDEPSPAAFLGFSGPVTAETARRLLCDANIARVVTDGASEVLDAGRSRRDANAVQVRALLAIWHGCARCGAPPAYCEAHHVKWWHRDNGPTDLANLLPLCWACHSAVHHAGLTIERHPDGAVTFTAPNGNRQRRVPP